MQPARTKKLLSVVVPVYFEADGIDNFYHRTAEALSSLAPEFDTEFVFVNDGSTDGTMDRLLALREKDPRVKILSFSRNFGQQSAVTAGLDHAAGDIVVIMDADLQDPPEVILQMVEKWREGYKVVYGVREKRNGETAAKLVTSKLFYRVMGWLSDVRIPHDTGDFRLMDRSAVNAFRTMREETRYVRGMVSWVGFKQCGIRYVRDARYAGTTKWSFCKLFHFAVNNITSFSEKPLIFAGYFGLFITIVSFAVMIDRIIAKILHPEVAVNGWSSLMSVIVFFGGVQLLSLGVLGQYIGRIYREVKRRPLYIIEQAWGVEPKTDAPPTPMPRD